MTTRGGSSSLPGARSSLAAMPWPAVPPRPLVLVPLGSTEQHGPHLPFDTDARIASAVAAASAERLRVSDASAGQDVVVAPVLAYGASGEHQHFAGTVSMGQEALQFVLIELVRSLSTWAGRIVLVNGHGGNAPTLASAVPQLIAEGHAVSWVPCAAAAAARTAPAQDAHAGRTETSLMLHLAPEVVSLPLPPAGNTAPLSELLPAMRAGGVAAVSPSGILGDPTGATADEGAELLAAIAEEVAACIRTGAPDARGLLAGAAGEAP